MDVDVTALQGEPEKTVCLVAKLSRRLTRDNMQIVREQITEALADTKWSGLKVLVIPPHLELELVSYSQELEDRVRELEKWQDHQSHLMAGD